MKKLLFFLASVCILSTSAFSQTPLTTAADFDVTLTDGEAFNLQSKLDEGKYVVLDFLFVTCGPCQANQPYFTQAYQNFGCNESDVYFLSIERDADDAGAEAYEANYGGENAPPIVSGIDGGGAAVNTLYQIGAWPTFILIAPDGSILEQDMWPLNGTADTFTTYLNSHDIETAPGACVVSVDEVSTEADINVYPNPTSLSATVSLAGFSGQVTIQVLDVLGKEVSSFTSTNSSEVISFTEMEAGNYVVRAFNDTAEVTKRVSVIK